MTASSSTEYPTAPRVAVGVVVIHDGRVLLVERGKPPSEGLWAVPGGSVELGETLAEAAERETLEETGLRVQADAVLDAFDAIVPDDDDGRVRFHYVIVNVRARYLDGTVVFGDDVRAAAWCTPADVARLDGPNKNNVSPRTIALLTKLGFLTERPATATD